MKKSLKIKWSRKFKGGPLAITISKDSSGRYFVSFLVREIIKPLKKTIGIDLGIKDFAVIFKATSY
jgi:putative transposase